MDRRASRRICTASVPRGLRRSSLPSQDQVQYRRYSRSLLVLLPVESTALGCHRMWRATRQRVLLSLLLRLGGTFSVISWVRETREERMEELASWEAEKGEWFALDYAEASSRW